MGNLYVSAAGIVESWQSRSGSSIIYPATVNLAGKERGGIFACAPNFGLVSQGPTWHKAEKLPQHGLLRLKETRLVEQSDEVSGDGTHTRSYAGEFGGTVIFPWRFFATIRWVYLPEREQLFMQLVVTRLRQCAEPNLMPLSGGFHPYFATAGDDFAVEWLNGQLLSTDDFRKGRSFPKRHSIRLKRGREVIEVLPVSGFDRFVVWSDEKEKYVCIEPTFGTHDVICLKPGETWSALATVTYYFLGL